MHSGESPFPRAPELCVEVISPANSSQAMEEKRGFYFAQGAEEVWFCDEQGRLTFHDISGRLSASWLFPGLYQIQSVHLH
jgi:Uma2 family endonuclease